MKLTTKIRKAAFEKKTALWQEANLNKTEAYALVEEMVLTLPGSYKLRDRQYGTNLIDAVYEAYGWMPSMFVSEAMLLGLQTLYPDKVYASFTLGLDVIEIYKGKIKH